MEKHKSEEWLKEKYWEKELSQREISNLCGVNRKTIGRWMNKFDIDVRSDMEQASLISQTDCEEFHESKSWLIKKHEEDRLNLKEMANICGCTGETVRYWMKKYSIEREIIHDTGCKRSHTEESWLREKYIEEDCTLEEMSDLCGCSDQVVISWMNKCGVETKSPSEKVLTCDMKHEDEVWLWKMYNEKGMSIDDIGNACGCSDSVIRRMMVEFNIEVKDYSCSGNHRDREWLRGAYFDNNNTTIDVAEMCGCSQGNISSWLIKYDIPRGPKKFRCGEDHWNYKHGEETREELELRETDEWKEFSWEKKEEVGWECEYCGSNGELHTHHVEPISLGGDGWDNEFIVLCKYCHIIDDYTKWHPPQLADYIE